MKKSSFISVLLLCVASMALSASVQQPLNIEDPAIQKERVKLIDEFRSRFNDAVKRGDQKGLAALFDMEGAPVRDGNARKTAQKLVGSALKNGVQLDFNSPLWYIKADCEGKYKGKTQKITLYLNIKDMGDGVSTWCVAGAEADILRLAPAVRKPKAMLGPAVHEVHFMNLHDVTTLNRELITQFGPAGYSPDPLTVFFTMVYDGSLQIDYVSDMEVVFTQAPGYVFAIREYERESTNSGWLIYRVFEASDEEKLNMQPWLNLLAYSSAAPVQEDKDKTSDNIRNKAVVTGFFTALSLLNTDREKAMAITDGAVAKDAAIETALSGGKMTVSDFLARMADSEPLALLFGEIKCDGDKAEVEVRYTLGEEEIKDTEIFTIKDEKIIDIRSK